MSVSRLHEAMNGRRGISRDLAEKILHKLALDSTDSELFLCSVTAEHSRSRREKQKAQLKLNDLLKEAEPPTKKIYSQVSWLGEVLLKINERESVFENTEKVARSLSVPEFMIIEPLRFLTRLGFLQKTDQFKTYLENRKVNRKLNIDYTQILEQAQKASLNPSGQSAFAHQVVLLEEENAHQADRILKEAFRKIQRLETVSQKSKAFMISYQKFDIEK